MLEVVVRSGPAGTAWLVLAGELDLAHAARAEGALDDLVSDPSHRWVLVDVRGLEFMEVTSLSMPVRAEERMAAAGRHEVIVRDGDGPVGRLIRAAALDRHPEWVLDPEDIARPADRAGARHLRRRRRRARRGPDAPREPRR